MNVRNQELYNRVYLQDYLEIKGYYSFKKNYFRKPGIFFNRSFDN